MMRRGIFVGLGYDIVGSPREGMNRCGIQRMAWAYMSDIGSEAFDLTFLR